MSGRTDGSPCPPWKECVEIKPAGVKAVRGMAVWRRKEKADSIEGDLEGREKLGSVVVTADRNPPADRRIDLQ